MSKGSEMATEKKTPTTRVADSELQALNKIGVVLNSLTEDTRRRVLAWTNDKYEAKTKGDEAVAGG